MHHAESRETFGDFRGEHRRAIVTESRARYPPFHNRLRQPVRYVRRVFREVPLPVTDEP